MIITITLNPALDKTVQIANFQIGEVNRVASTQLDAGGKGINVSKVIKSLGGKSIAAGLLGGSTGLFIKEYVDCLGIENRFLFIEGETRINLKVVDGIRKTNTDINEPGPSVKSEDVDKLGKTIFDMAGEDTIMVFSGSVPQNVDKGIYGNWISNAKQIGVKTILDADGELLKHGIAAGPYLVKPNIHELERFFDTRIEDAAEAESFGRKLIELYGVEIVAVSLGERGAIFLNKETSILAHGIKVDVKSTVGAGDSMVAALAYSIDKGYSFERTATLAAAAGTANVMTSGSQPAELGVINELEKKVKLEYFHT